MRKKNIYPFKTDILAITGPLQVQRKTNVQKDGFLFD